MLTTDITGNLGNHLWQYAVCRTIAEDVGLTWGINPIPYGDYHQGANQMDFMNIDFGLKVEGIEYEYKETITQIHHVDVVNIHHYDSDIRSKITDNTKLVGCWQTEKYIKHNKENIKKWFEIKKENVDVYEEKLKNSNIHLDDNTCVINIRGGEYRGYPLLILNKEYFLNAMNHIKKHNPNINFIVVSDDVGYASSLLGLPTYHFDIGMDYYMINKAKYLILSKSSFAYFPAWLNENCNMVIAPKYWSRHNVSNGYWGNSDIQTEGWLYLSKENEIFTYEECI
jgi:hypothetical protein